MSSFSTGGEVSGTCPDPIGWFIAVLRLSSSIQIAFFCPVFGVGMPIQIVRQHVTFIATEICRKSHRGLLLLLFPSLL